MSAETKQNNWLMDMGANIHITNNRNNLTEVKTCDETVKVGNGSVLLAREHGKVMLRQKTSGKTIGLEQVLYVPNFAKKIVSLTLLNDKGNDVKLTENGMEISKGDNKMIILKKSGLYYLEVMSTIGGDNENQENLEETGKECIFINTAGLYHPTLQGSKYWVKIVCDATGCSFDYFIGKKSEVLGIFKGFISKVKARGHEVKFVCCDNAGEHQSTFKLV
jgi:hypothetical protein